MIADGLPTLWGGLGGVVRFTPDGAALLVGTGVGQVARWPVRDYAAGPETVREVWGVAVSPDGTRLAVAADDEPTAGRRSVFVFGGPNFRQPLWSSSEHRATATAVAYARGGDVLVTTSLDNDVRFWGAADGAPLGTIPKATDGGGCRRLAVSPDGQDAATAGKDGWVRVWDVRTGAPRGAFAPPRPGLGAVLGLAFHPAGRFVAASYWAERVLVWDRATGTVHAEYGIPGPPNRLAYIPDGATLGVGCQAGQLHVIDTATGRVAWSSPPLPEITAVTNSPDGRVLVSGDLEGGLHLWPPRGGAELVGLRGHRAKVNAVAFTPGGRQLVSADHDGHILLWPAKPAP